MMSHFSRQGQELNVWHAVELSSSRVLLSFEVPDRSFAALELEFHTTQAGTGSSKNTKFSGEVVLGTNCFWIFYDIL